MIGGLCCARGLVGLGICLVQIRMSLWFVWFLAVCLVRTPRQCFDFRLSLPVWRRWLLEMLVRLALAARLGQ